MLSLSQPQETGAESGSSHSDILLAKRMTSPVSVTASTASPRLCNSFTRTRNDAGMPGSSMGSPLTIASYALTRPCTSSDLSSELLKRVGRTICLQRPHLHLAETLTTKLRLATQRLLRHQGIGAGRPGVDFVFNQVGQLHHMDDAHGNRLIIGFSSPPSYSTCLPKVGTGNPLCRGTMRHLLQFAGGNLIRSKPSHSGRSIPWRWQLILKVAQPLAETLPAPVDPAAPSRTWSSPSVNATISSGSYPAWASQAVNTFWRRYNSSVTARSNQDHRPARWK